MVQIRDICLCSRSSLHEMRLSLWQLSDGKYDGNKVNNSLGTKFHLIESNMSLKLYKYIKPKCYPLFIACAFICTTQQGGWGLAKKNLHK